MITGPAQRKMVLMPSSTRRPSLPNSGPRWSITGISIARRMRSGTGVGPGICRKWRPAVRAEFWDMEELDLQECLRRLYDIVTGQTTMLYLVHDKAAPTGDRKDSRNA